MNKFFKFYKKHEDGQILVLVALMLVGFIGFAGLLTDGGMMQLSKRELQAAADAAALAGANFLPYQPTKAVETARNYVLENDLLESNIKSITTPYDGDNRKIEVVLEKQASFTFGRIFNPSGSMITARAVAMRYPKWAGEALPFINLDDNYDDDPNIELWEKVSPGDFENIGKDEYEIFNYEKKQTCDTSSMAYFKVEYLDGIELKKGEDAEKKDEVQCVFNQENDPVFIISLRNDVIEQQWVEMENGEIRSLKADATGSEKLKNNDIIPLSQLVLLECHWDSYDKNKKTLTLTCYEDYDINNDELPENYYNPDGGTSNLIE